MKIDNWLFVTGAPRSGTTFAGRVLSLPLSVDYIHEPFNPDCGIPGFEHPYLYVRRGTSEESFVRGYVEALTSYRFSLRTAIYARDGFAKRLVKHVIGSRGPFYLRLAKLNPFHRSAVVKDPVGCLLADYLTREHGFRALVLVRHPVAFVASTLRLGWDMKLRLDALSRQASLMDDFFDGCCLAPAAKGNDPVSLAAAFWRALNRVLLAQATENPGLTVLAHEEMSARPLETFKRLFRAYDLPWRSRVAKKIEALTRPSNTREARGGRVQDFARDSAGIAESSFEKTTRAQRERVWEITGDVAEPMYPQSTFQV